jgi:hypothetical protein
VGGDEGRRECDVCGAGRLPAVTTIAPMDDVAPDDVGSDERDLQRLRDVIESSGEFAGAAIGGAVGLIGGPPGAIGGAVAGVVITKAVTRVGLEVHDRLIVRRQQERVGAALATVYEDVHEQLDNGATPREDGFFDPPSDGRRADAEEVLEGALRAAADANEERKVRHIAAIFPSVSLRADITAADAHWLVKVAEQLSWRQMVVLSVLADPPVDRFKTQQLEREDRGLPCASATLAEEVEDLGRLGLVGQTRTDGEIVRAGATLGSMGSLWAVPIAGWRLTAAGTLLVEAARLGEIGSEDQKIVVEQLLDQGRASE